MNQMDKRIIEIKAELDKKDMLLSLKKLTEIYNNLGYEVIELGEKDV